MKTSSSLSKLLETGINVFKCNSQIMKNTKYYENQIFTNAPKNNRWQTRIMEKSSLAIDRKMHLKCNIFLLNRNQHEKLIKIQEFYYYNREMDFVLALVLLRNVDSTLMFLSLLLFLFYPTLLYREQKRSAVISVMYAVNLCLLFNLYNLV